MSAEIYKSLREANVARDKLWNPDKKLSLLFRGVELAGEVGEALNLVKKMERARLGIPGTRIHVSELADELGDVVIAADLLAMDAGINLEKATAVKFNATSAKHNFPVHLSHVTDRPAYNPAVGRIFEHVKTKGRYAYIGAAVIQTAKPLTDDSTVIVYRSVADGSLWVRSDTEFFDGRFEVRDRFSAPDITTATPLASPWPVVVDDRKKLQELLDERTAERDDARNAVMSIAKSRDNLLSDVADLTERLNTLQQDHDAVLKTARRLSDELDDARVRSRAAYDQLVKVITQIADSLPLPIRLHSLTSYDKFVAYVKQRLDLATRLDNKQYDG